MPTINIEITDQRREDMIVGAIEGGSNYWYWLGDDATNIIDEYCKNPIGRDHPLVIGMWKAIQDGKSIPIRDLEDENTVLGSISLQSIKEGEQLMADQQPKHLMDIVNEMDDANTADIWFQFCVLKELTYG